MHECSRMPLVTSLLLAVFLGLGYLLSGAWSPKQCWVWDTSHEVTLKSNQSFVGYSHKLCATIVLAYFAGRTDCRSKVL